MGEGSSDEGAKVRGWAGEGQEMSAGGRGQVWESRKPRFSSSSGLFLWSVVRRCGTGLRPLTGASPAASPPGRALSSRGVTPGSTLQHLTFPPKFFTDLLYLLTAPQPPGAQLGAPRILAVWTQHGAGLWNRTASWPHPSIPLLPPRMPSSAARLAWTLTVRVGTRGEPCLEAPRPPAGFRDP